MTEIKLTTGVWEYDESQPLGQPGGFGQVFKGSSKDYPEVAIKRLHVTAAAAAHRELEIAASLLGRPSDHVIRFLDIGEDAETGGYFIVMAKADYSLEQQIESGVTFEASEVANILLQAAKGLGEAGDVVHRDMKPGNLLFHEGKWKVADFGIARFVDEVTASNTLKGYLSPYCAAPEQWKLERAKSPADIYAMGCIGYWLINKAPPFVSDPQQEHQFSPVPAFTCSDARLSSLINMMLRKEPATRPSLKRLITILTEIVTKPISQISSIGILAHAGAKVAEQEQIEQAKLQSQQDILKNRKELLTHGFKILRQSIETLWEKISLVAPAAVRTNNDSKKFTCSLGRGSITVNFNSSSNIIAIDTFKHSKWDILGVAQLIVSQHNPQYSWTSLLCFGKRPGTDEYRWHEMMFWSLDRSGLIGVSNVRDIDFALSNVMHSVMLAFGPALMDDENEEQFHERCHWLLAKASTGHLRNPSNLPISSWPPNM